MRFGLLAQVCSKLKIASPADFRPGDRQDCLERHDSDPRVSRLCRSDIQFRCRLHCDGSKHQSAHD
jgi:hypothetical protein